jgi:thiol-disulfide isomerase/thioredoxin/uncharacterized membrane protein YphA (DoxX/SURF4 family)
VQAIVLGCRVVLALVFVVSGTAKLIDRRGTSDAVRSFGMPASLVPTISWCLPAVEIVAAVLVLFAATALWGASIMLALLGAFVVVVTTSLRQGAAHDCHCFGSIKPRPISRRLIVADAGLAVVALVVVATSVTDVARDLTSDDHVVATTVLLGALVAALVATVALVTAVLRLRSDRSVLQASLTEAESQLDDLETWHAARRPPPAPEAGLPIGVPAPAFALDSAAGAAVELSDLVLQGHPTLLLFTSPDCAPCRELLPEIDRWTHELGDQLTVAVITRGTAKHGAGQRSLRRATLLDEGHSGVSERYRARWTPAAVVVGGDGRIASAVAFGPDAVRSLVQWATDHHEVLAHDHLVAPTGAPRGDDELVGVGDRVPPFRADLDDGSTFDSQALERDTALVFWNPSCPYCRELEPQLMRAYAESDRDLPALVLVSSQAPAGPTVGPLLLDDDGLDRRFGSPGTPSAVLLRPDGRVASDLVSGAPDVRALLGLADDPRDAVEADERVRTGT